MSCGMCGNDLRLTTDERLKLQWNTDEETCCWACVVREVRRRVLNEKHKGDENLPKHEPHFMDGREFPVGLLDLSAVTDPGDR